MTCPHRHPITDKPCARTAGHGGQHNPHSSEDPWTSETLMTPEQQHLMARFGYLPDPEAVALVDARHAAAVARANPQPHTEPAPVEPVVVTGWQTGTGHTVAHRFRTDNARSLCGWTDANPFRRVQPAPREVRCSRCEAAAGRGQVAA